MNFQMFIAIAIFFIVYIFITTEYINKTIAVLVGSVLVILFGIVKQDKVFSVIDWNVIFLLVSMMIIVGITKNTGLFQYVAIKSAKIAKGNPIIIMILLFFITAVFSAFLDNVTTVLILTPVTILIAVELGLSPVPFIISEVIASNVGGAATLIGDPPNIMIGSAAKLSFNDFIVNLSLVVFIMLIATVLLLFFIYRKQLVVTQEKKARIMDFDESKAITDPQLLIKSLVVLALVIVGFVLHGMIHLEASIVALTGAAFLMLLSVIPRHSEVEHVVEKFYKEIEWGTIFFFIGLFILVDGLVEMGVIKIMAEGMMKITGSNMALGSFIIVWGSGIFSAIIDNIPFVATMIPMIQEMTTKIEPAAAIPLWFSLSIGACIGGNGTLIGASANVVAAGIAGKSGYKISFMEFTKIGVLSTFINLIIGSAYIYIRYYL